MMITLPKLATAFWLLAFVFSFTWMSTYEVEFIILTLGSLFVASALSDSAGIKGREWPVPCSPVLIAGGLFWAVALVSLATSDIFFVSWLYFFFFSCLPLTIVFFLAGHGAELRLRIAGHGLRLILAALAAYALAQYFFMPKMLTTIGRVYAPLADPNSLAAVFSLGIFLTAGHLLKNGTTPKWPDYVLLFLLGAAFFAAGSRGAMLALLFMTIVFAAMVGVKHIPGRLWVVLGAMAVVIIATIGFVTPRAGVGPFSMFSQPILQALQGPIGDRLTIWSSTLQIIREHLWFGTGIGTFQYYYPEMRAATDVTYGYMAHNDPLQFFAEMGIAAPVLFYAIILLALQRTWATLKLVPQGDERRIDVLAPLLGLGALVLHSHLTYNFYVLPILMLAGFCFASWYIATAKIRAEQFRIFYAPRWMNKDALEAVFLIVAFIAIVAVAGPFYSQRLVQQAQTDLEYDRLEGFANKVNLADTLSAGTNAQAYSQAAMIPLGMLQQTQKKLSADERKKFIDDATRLLQRGSHENPRDPNVMIQQAQLANIEGNPQLAEVLLRQAMSIDPLYLPARMALGDHLDKNGKRDEAVEIMNAGLDLKYGPQRAQKYMEYFIQTMAMQEAQAKRQGRKAPKAGKKVP